MGAGLDLVAVMVDGVHFAASCCVVALGIGIDGVKHPLALVEGSTENATLVTGLLVGNRNQLTFLVVNSAGTADYGLAVVQSQYRAPALPQVRSYI